MELIAQPYRRYGWKKIIAGIGQIANLYKVIKKNKIAAIHPFCTPAGSIGYLLARLSGAALVIDSYEPHATAMVKTGAWKKKQFFFQNPIYIGKKAHEKSSTYNRDHYRNEAVCFG